MKIIKQSRNKKITIIKALGKFYVQQLRDNLPMRTASYTTLKDADKEYKRLRA